MITYCPGLTLKTTKIITKKDISVLCDELNKKYTEVSFKPEKISEGGIIFNFKDNLDNQDNRWYKSVRLCAYKNIGAKWYWVEDNCLSEWNGSDDLIFPAKVKFTIFLKSFYGAPLFTIEELKIWEECFNQIGIIKVGRYPSKKSLRTESKNLSGNSNSNTIYKSSEFLKPLLNVIYEGGNVHT